jgi:V/A-type H+-transporting ATPase subunit F
MEDPMKIYVIGCLDAVLGFGLVGVHGHVVNTRSEAEQTLDEALKDPMVGIVLVTEDAADLMRSRMTQLLSQSTSPIVVEIPGPNGAASDRPSLNEVIRKAVGVKL